MSRTSPHDRPAETARLPRVARELGLPAEAIDRLTRAGVATVAELRAAGGAGRLLEEAPGGDLAEGLRLLDAHAALSVLPVGEATVTRLRDAGMRSVLDVAAAGDEELRAALGPAAGGEELSIIRGAAGAQAAVLTTAAAGARVSGARGGPVAQAASALLSGTCDRDRCTSALSPLAYLADLLDFAVRHLRRPVTSAGLEGRYFAAPGQPQPALTRLDAAIDFDWGAGAPAPGLPVDGFSVTWSGAVRPPASETFTFRVEADDTTDVALWVDGALIVDPRETTAVARWGSIALEDGRATSLRLDYADRTGPARIRLLWSSASQAEQVVPAARLSHRSGWQAMTLTALETRLRQPLRNLPASCSSVDDPVRRARIAIEVMRAERPGLGTAPAYLLGAYETLLEGIGTSYEELRRVVRTKDKAGAEALCARIGVPARRVAADPDLPAELWLEDADLSEARLEQLFGLRDTTRPPLAPDVEGALADWRPRALEIAWDAEDWPAAPAADAPPLIDPDIAGPLDMVDGRPSTAFPRPARRAMDFYEDRRRWADDTAASVRYWRDQPGAGLDWIVTDQISDGLGHVQFLGLGLGMGMAELTDLVARRGRGEDIRTDLARLRMDVDALDAFAAMWATLATGPLSEPEWTSLASILVQRQKRLLFPAWRAAERAAGLSLSPAHFRLRATADGEPAWTATLHRSTGAARRAWVDVLEARIDQRAAALEGLRTAVEAAEDSWLPVMREGLLLAIQLPATWSQARVTALSRRFQIDLQGGTGSTTRVAAAIESLQGLLHGARTGLLGEGDLELDDVERFDRAWEWLGSLAPWRAAMRVFCYPETVLRPTLRQRRSQAMSDVIEDLRAQEPITPEVARAAAERYAAYFRDVCSLTFDAVAEYARPGAADDLGPPGPRFALVARGGGSGALYACVQDARPDWWLASGFDRTPWRALPGVPVASAVRSAFGYRAPDGGGRVGLVTESSAAGVPRVVFSSFDGAVWRPPVDIDPPVVFCAANLADGRVPGPAPGDPGLPVGPADQVVAVDVDGDGRSELIVLAAGLAADGTRPVALLRESGGGLVVAWRGTIPGGWQQAGAEPVVLRTALLSSSPRRGRERLLVQRPTAGGVELGLLGARADGSLALIAAANGPAVAGAAGVSGWAVAPGARFLAADLDGDGLHELVAIVGPRADLNADVIVMAAGDAGFAVRANQVAALVPATASRAGAIADATAPGRDVLLITTSREGTDPLDPPPALYAMAWNGAASALRYETVVPAAFTYPGTVSSSDPEDQALPSAGQGLLAGDAWVPVDADPSHDGPEMLWTRPGEPLTMLVRMKPAATAQTRLLEILWRRAERVAAGPGTAEWVRALDDRFVGADLDGDGAQEIVALRGDGSAIGVIRRGGDGGLSVAKIASAAVRGPSGSSDAALPVGPGMRLIVADLDGDGCQEILVRRGEGLAVLRGPRPAKSAAALGVRERYGPFGVRDLDLIDRASPRWREDRPSAIRAAYDAEAARPDDPDLLYLDEAYHDLPVELGVRLTDAGHFVEALDWLRSVYDYGQPAADRRIAYRLVLDARGDVSFARTARWLEDPLDPHAIAATRSGSYNRFAILMIVRTLSAYADARFSSSGPELVPRADDLFVKVLELLDSPDLNYRDPLCDTIIGSLEIPIGDDEITWLWTGILDRMRRIEDVATLSDLAGRLRAANGAEELGQVLTLADAALARPSDSLETVLSRDAATATDASILLLADPAVARAVTLAGARGRWTPDVVPAPRPSFWVPPNPVVDALRRHARLARDKILAGRDVNGALVELGPYAAPTFADAGPELGAESLVPPRQSLKPLPYRYATLVERTKQLVALARELEAASVAAREAAGQRRYEELRARQDMALARSAVRIKDLQVSQAQDGARGAEIQRDRSSIQLAHYDSLIANGWSTNEEAALGFQAAAAILQAGAAVSYAVQAWTPDGWTSFGSGPVASALSSAASAAATAGGIASTYASLERRDQEWRLQQSVTANDVRQGQNQMRLAQDQLQIAVGERAVTGLQVDHAEEVLDFLAFRRFGTAERYEWMSGVFTGIYRFFLQQGTSLAKLAEAQLAFERQSTLPAFIKDDYWQSPDRAPAPGSADPAAGATADQDFGVTGSARLLRDVVALDEYAFRTAKRKLQLSKTFSLARLDPVAFEGFRRTGVLPFATPMELFDHDFPGHYLRLVQRVRTSVLALVPAAQGIRATLATTGRSQVTLGPDGFETVAVQRGPETVALSSAMNASGLFELDPQPEILAPFEGIGVNATWQLTMPRAANPLDYGSIADVLVTIDYTALDSVNLRSQVVARLDRRATGARALSLRHDFPDAWYDLNNPELIDDPAAQMVVTLETTAGDFPPNVEDIRIGDVAMLVSRAGDAPAEVAIAGLTYDALGFTVRSGAMTTTSGLVGVRRGNAAALAPAIGRTPVGSWTLSFNFGDPVADAAIRARFAADRIEDILLVISFRGTTPAWP